MGPLTGPWALPRASPSSQRAAAWQWLGGLPWDPCSSTLLYDCCPQGGVHGKVVGSAVGVAAADQFFNGDQGLVSVWDFDYDTIIDFETQLKCAQLAFVPPLWSD